MSPDLRHEAPGLGSARRVVRNSREWFAEGARLKRDARRSRRCVECRRALPDRRSPYCSRSCQWGFRGRYFWDAARSFVMHRDRYTCQLCRRRFRVRHLEVDHVVEIARGGPSLDYLNLQTLCRACHRVKTRRFLSGPNGWRRRAIRPETTPTVSAADGDWGADWFPS